MGCSFPDGSAGEVSLLDSDLPSFTGRVPVCRPVTGSTRNVVRRLTRT